MRIIETITGQGVTTTENTEARLRDPRPGDAVDFGENAGTYPYTSGRYGRIEQIGPGDWVPKGMAHLCCKPSSVFLNADGTVSISGGAFGQVDLGDLEPTLKLKVVMFWNWADHRPEAHQGTEYYILRPLFRLKKQKRKEQD